MTQISQPRSTSNSLVSPPIEAPLSRPDRRLLLGASLRVLHDRFSHGRPIFQSDVLRVATLADDAREQTT